MFCPKCGARLDDEQFSYCPKCGASIKTGNHSTGPNTQSDQPAPQPTVSDRQFAQTAKTENRRLLRVIIPLVIIIAAIVVILAVVLTTRSHTGTTSDSALAENVEITDVSLSSEPFYGWAYNQKGYVIGMTVSNDNDVSCDIAPALQITMETVDEYYDTEVKDVILTAENDYIFSPYAKDGISTENGYVPPVGLAPHESKTVYYYFQSAYVLDGKETIKEDFSGANDATGVKLVDYTVNEASCEYLDVTKNVLDYHTDNITSSQTQTGHRARAEGTVLNDTDQRWREAGLQFDYTASDYAVTNAVLYHGFQSSDHSSRDGFGTAENVEKGETVTIQTTAFGAINNDTTVKCSPSLLWYEPETL